MWAHNVYESMCLSRQRIYLFKNLCGQTMYMSRKYIYIFNTTVYNYTMDMIFRIKKKYSLNVSIPKCSLASTN